MEIFLIKLLQFILSISLLVLLHEGGHALASKLFGVRVEKFFIFFDVSIGKWSGKLFSFKPKNSETEYGMGWLPLGGYCKIAGMIDESMDTEQMERDPQPWEFRTKPAWQRLIIMVAGVTVQIQGSAQRLRLDRITFFESEAHRIRAFGPDEDIVFYMKMDDLEEMVADRGFIRCHQSYLVNGQWIRGMTSGILTLINRNEIPVSRRYQKAVRSFIDQTIHTVP